MKKDIVIISTKEYNELRDLKMNIEMGNSYAIRHGIWHGLVETRYFTEHEMVADFHEKNELLIKEKSELERKHADELQRIRKMSWFDFRRWKKAVLNKNQLTLKNQK